MSRPRQRASTARSLPALARFAWLALLVLGIACAPALSSAAELHDLVAHADDHAGDPPGARGHDHADAGDRDGEGDGQVLHAVMLLGGCCGHASATLPGTPLLPDLRAAARPDARVDALPPDAGTETLLRPPIAA